MGVSGCGKTVVGTQLAHILGCQFVEGDDLHSVENVRKMASGSPLDDDDRRPWLRRVGRALAAAEAPIVVSCSALKRSYRDQIREQAGDVEFLHLSARPETVRQRLGDRDGHFMPLVLLSSQLDTLEPLGPDEIGATLDADRDSIEIIAAASEYICQPVLLARQRLGDASAGTFS